MVDHIALTTPSFSHISHVVRRVLNKFEDVDAKVECHRSLPEDKKSSTRYEQKYRESLFGALHVGMDEHWKHTAL